MIVLLLLTSTPRTLRVVRGGSAAGPFHSRHEPHARLPRPPCRTYDGGHAGGPSACRRVWPSPSPPRARPSPPRRASSHRWRSPCRHRPRCRHRGSNGPSPFASCTLPLVTPALCTSPLLASTPTCAFMPKYH